MTMLLEAWLFVLGACIGSFANASAYRIPRDLSLTYSRSRCSRCGIVVPWYHNIPILSCLALGARCNYCKTYFGIHHMIIELLVGLVCVTVYRRFGVSVTGIYFFILFVTCTIISLIDLEFQIIPDSLSLPGLAISITLAVIFSLTHTFWWVTWDQAVLGALAGAGSLWFVNFVYEKIFNRTGIGFGDVKLLAFLGANCGVKGVITTIFLASALGSIVGLFLILLRGKTSRTPIPFGPFLCVAWFVAMHDLRGQLSDKFFSFISGLF